MLEQLLRFAIPAAYTLLPSAMASDRATAMLLAIGLQESRLLHRRQLFGGPARSFLQFERIGVAGVMSHRSSRVIIAHAIETLRYTPSVEVCYEAIEHNDVLAMCFGRCLLWTLPSSLPHRDQADEAWQQYLKAWRPGKPHKDTWPECYAKAWAAVAPNQEHHVIT